MSRISKVERENASEQVKSLYQGLEKQMGKVPNIFKHMANSPLVLQVFLGLNDALGKTSLSPKLQEKIALTTAQINKCNYCLSAHSMIAALKGLGGEEIELARAAQSMDEKDAAILRFVQNVIEKRGRIPQEELDIFKKQGVTDQEIVELILAININMFTNYFNNIIDPEIDFPLALHLPQV